MIFTANHGDSHHIRSGVSAKSFCEDIPELPVRSVGEASHCLVGVWLQRVTEAPGRVCRSPELRRRTQLHPTLFGTPACPYQPSSQCALDALNPKAALRKNSSYPTHFRTSPPANFFHESGKPITRRKTGTISTDSRILLCVMSRARSSTTHSASPRPSR